MNDPLPHTTPVSPPLQLRLGARLGAGGLSRVWGATMADGTAVAVKVCDPAVANPAAARALVRREYALLEALSHRHIVSVFGLMDMAGTGTGGGLGLVMEYVGGGDLVSLTGSRPAKWLPVAAQLADALRYLHASGVVHRDVKARNVLLRPGDEPCLIDFGLAGAAGGWAPRGGGTAAYQSPNQRRGGPPAPSDDVFAFAVLVYELWTGTLPFGRNPSLPTPERAVEARMAPVLRTSRGLERLAELVRGALRAPRKDPHGGIEGFADALELALAD